MEESGDDPADYPVDGHSAGAAGDGCEGAGSGLGKAEFFAGPFGGRVVVVGGGDCWAVEPGAASAAVTFCHG